MDRLSNNEVLEVSKEIEYFFNERKISFTEYRELKALLDNFYIQNHLINIHPIKSFREKDMQIRVLKRNVKEALGVDLDNFKLSVKFNKYKG